MAEYKVTLGKTYPHVSVEDLKKHNKAILGISMNNPVFWRSSLKHILHWSLNNFEHSYFVIGDYLNRHNELILTSDRIDIAEHNSETLGKKMRERVLHYLEDTPSSSYTIIHWREFFQSEIYKAEIDRFLNAYDSDVHFHAELNRQADRYIHELLRRGKKLTSDKETAIQYSVKYLIEELAVFNLMMKKDADVLIYPGVQLPIFIAFSEGKFNQSLHNINAGIYVHLMVQKK